MISSIYQNMEFTSQVKPFLSTVLERGVACALQPNVFFRADDIGVPSKNFSRMMDLFIQYRVPLCLAVVPAWLTTCRWDFMENMIAGHEDLFCLHMHGWRHINYETKGKKQEFGPSRSPHEIFHDLRMGKIRLESIMKDNFFPFFTPPWNRCSSETMQGLKQMGFYGISRSHGATPIVPEKLLEFPINVDLHTRKEKSSHQGWQNLFREIELGLESGVCGIMLHHMRMNDHAFIFLEHLLNLINLIKTSHKIKLSTFKELRIGSKIT